MGTPDAGTFWRIIEEHKVNVLSTAPTALRAIRRDDPENKFFKAVGKRGGLKQLRALFLAGERSEPSIVQMYQELLKNFAASGALVIDNWWSSESGSPISGIALAAAAGNDRSSVEDCKPLAIKPGSAGKPMPGFDVRVVDDEGNEVAPGVMGNIVLAIPLAPTGFTTLFNDGERFYKGYLKRFKGRWVDTGDAGMIDMDGYVHVMSRSDDIINVAAHRFSTGENGIRAGVRPSVDIKNFSRIHRTSYLLPPHDRGMLRRGCSGCPQRPPPVCLRHALDTRPPHLSRAFRGTVYRRTEIDPGADRGHCIPRRHDPRQRHDSEDAEWEDTTASITRVGRKCGSWRARQRGSSAGYGRRCSGSGGGEREDSGILRHQGDEFAQSD